MYVACTIIMFIYGNPMHQIYIDDLQSDKISMVATAVTLAKLSE